MRSQSGQAVIEYIMIFAFLGLITISFVKGVGSYFGGTVGSLAHELTQHLSTGMCDQFCFHNAFQNKKL